MASKLDRFIKRPSRSIPVIKEIDDLPLKDIERIFSSLQKYAMDKKAVEEEYEIKKSYKINFDEEKKHLERFRDNFKAQNIDPISDRQNSLKQEISKYEIGIIRGLFNKDYVEFIPYYDSFDESKILSVYPATPLRIERLPRALSLIYDYNSMLERKKQKISELNQKTIKINKMEIQKYKGNQTPYPKPEFKIKLAGNTAIINLNKLDINYVNDLLKKRRAEIEKDKQRELTLRAQAAQNIKQTRQIAQKERRRLNEQLALIDGCPYCGLKLVAQNAHLDHIYPVSKGGQSRLSNLVFVCSACNQKKRDLTLRSFIKLHNLHENSIHLRLDTLEKEF